MKKWRLAVLIMCGLLMAAGTFTRVEVPVYAYTQDEIDSAKEWLSANGYSPTRAGAEQAYQDYLNGKFGPVGGEEESEAPEAAEAVPEETQVVEAAAVVAAVETTVVETTETVTEETTVSEEETDTETSLEETLSVSEAVESTADMDEETDTEWESSSETEERDGSFIHVGRYDGIIVIFAIAACVAMGFFTYRYIKKEKKDGE